MTETNIKCGYVAIVGRPNVGKSTLLNAIVGENLAIVTPKPQTTRHRITGIYNSEDSQIIFLDTPGYHKSGKELNRVMNEIVDAVIHDVDVVCLLVETGEADTQIEKSLFERIGPKKTIVVLNKSDKIRKGEFDKLAEHFKEEWGARELLIVSALKKEGISALIGALKEHVPIGPKLFPDDIYTEHPVRFIAAEIIREQVFVQMHEEIPYSTAVVIDEFHDATEEKPITFVKATIVIEKESQKGMVIGKAGRRIKEIGKMARQKIEELVGTKVFLELNVRVERDWTKSREKIEKMGYVTAGKI